MVVVGHEEMTQIKGLVGPWHTENAQNMLASFTSRYFYI